MQNLIITVGSVTSAVRLAKKINALGIINASVIHTPPQINLGGCSYSVKTDYKYFSVINKMILEKKIKYKKMYKEETIESECVYDALS